MEFTNNISPESSDLNTMNIGNVSYKFGDVVTWLQISLQRDFSEFNVPPAQFSIIRNEGLAGEVSKTQLLAIHITDNIVINGGRPPVMVTMQSTGRDFRCGEWKRVKDSEVSRNVIEARFSNRAKRYAACMAENSFMLRSSRVVEFLAEIGYVAMTISRNSTNDVITVEMINQNPVLEFDHAIVQFDLLGMMAPAERLAFKRQEKRRKSGK